MTLFSCCWTTLAKEGMLCERKFLLKHKTYIGITLEDDVSLWLCRKVTSY